MKKEIAKILYKNLKKYVPKEYEATEIIKLERKLSRTKNIFKKIYLKRKLKKMEDLWLQSK